LAAGVGRRLIHDEGTRAEAHCYDSALELRCFSFVKTKDQVGDWSFGVGQMRYS
jgi:hypothetical protein